MIYSSFFGEKLFNLIDTPFVRFFAMGKENLFKISLLINFKFAENAVSIRIITFDCDLSRGGHTHFRCISLVFNHQVVGLAYRKPRLLLVPVH